MAEKDADEFKTDSCCLFNNNVNDRACTDDRKNKRKKTFMKIIKDEMTTDVNGLHEKEEALQIDMKRDWKWPAYLIQALLHSMSPKTLV